MFIFLFNSSAALLTAVYLMMNKCVVHLINIFWLFNDCHILPSVMSDVLNVLLMFTWWDDTWNIVLLFTSHMWREVQKMLLNFNHLRHSLFCFVVALWFYFIDTGWRGWDESASLLFNTRGRNSNNNQTKPGECVVEARECLVTCCKCIFIRITSLSYY